MVMTTREAPMTILDDGRETHVRARLDGETVTLRADAVMALGWDVESHGLDPDAVDLARLASVLRRPLAVDLAERAAWIGVSAVDRARALTGPYAPDFTLPDCDGRLHSLSEHRGKKVFLVAYASW